MAIKRPAKGWNLNGVATHPGAILREDFLKPLGISVNSLGLRLRVPVTRLHEIVNERRTISPDTALRLARYFSTTPEFWLNLQMSYELSKAKQELGDTIEIDVQPRITVAA